MGDPTMTVVYSDQTPPATIAKSIFLAGPSPRKDEDPNWRIPEALELLRAMGFTGTVFVPLPSAGGAPESYDGQVEWETAHLHMADLIAFWVPRTEGLPGFTTNVEFGLWCGSGKALLGHPSDALKVRFLQYHAAREHVPMFATLRETLAAAVELLGDGAERTGGERDIPLDIWKTSQFQAWHQTLKAAGNRLEGAKILWTFRVGPKRTIVLAYALQADIHVAAEGRTVQGGLALSRPDIAAVVAYHRPDGAGPEDTKIALVREFRSTGRTASGFIVEPPGGSSLKPNKTALETASDELRQETGLVVDPKRLRAVGARQVAGSFSTHQAHIFAVELTADEMDRLAAEHEAGIPHGNAHETERTYVEVHRFGDLLRPGSDLVDWAALGMIVSALAGDLA